MGNGGKGNGKWENRKFMPKEMQIGQGKPCKWPRFTINLYVYIKVNPPPPPEHTVV